MTRSKPKEVRMKIGALEEASGVSRDTIHFYVRTGLLHRPNKTGATIAYYDAAHLEKLKRVRTLRSHGLSLPTIRRLLSGENDRLGSDDLELIAHILQATEKVEAPRAAALSPETRSLADHLGLAAEIESDGRLAAATAGIAALPASALELARSMASTAVAQARAAAENERETMAAWLSAQDDPDVAVLALRRALSAVRGLTMAARDALVRGAIEDNFCQFFDAVARAGRVPMLPLAAEQVFEASVLERTLETRIASGEVGAYATLARLLFALGPARRLGEVTRRARRAGVGGPWIALGQGVAALDAGDARAARDAFSRARKEQPGWGLALVYEATAALLAAGVGSTGFLRESLAAIRALDRSDPSPDDPEMDQLWTLLIKSRSLLALPSSLARVPAAHHAAREVLARLELVPASDASRMTGEFTRLQGNALLTDAAACRVLGDFSGEKSALSRAETVPGQIGAEARARLTSARPAS